MLSTDLIPRGVCRLPALNFGLDPFVLRVLQFYTTSYRLSVIFLSMAQALKYI